MVKTRPAKAIFGVDNARALLEHFRHQSAPVSMLSQRAGVDALRASSLAGFTDGVKGLTARLLRW